MSKQNSTFYNQTILNPNKAHNPVLLKQFLFYTQQANATKQPIKMWDGTFGMGGHTFAWLQRNPNGRVFANDCDTEMIELVKKKPFDWNKIQVKHANFSENPFEEHAPFNVILLDIGISSLHIDYFSRGISFQSNDELDMRLDTQQGKPIHKWINIASLQDIKSVLKNYGEEKYSYAIAKEIVKTREKKYLLYVEDIKTICQNVYQRVQPNYFYSKTYTVRNPYVKIFQALRIHANQELDNLQKALEFMPSLLAVNGILAVISFHSLEDRIVKNAFKKIAYIKDESPFAKEYYQKSNYSVLSSKAIQASEEEIEQNSRAASAKMRILTRCS